MHLPPFLAVTILIATLAFSFLPGPAFAQSLAEQIAQAEEVARRNDAAETTARKIAQTLGQAFGPGQDSEALLAAARQMAEAAPAEAAAIAAAATVFVPSEAERIAAAIAAIVPNSAAAVAAAVAQVAPAKAEAIAAAVIAAVPDADPIAINNAVGTQTGDDGGGSGGGGTGDGGGPALPAGFGGGGGGGSVSDSDPAPTPSRPKSDSQ